MLKPLVTFFGLLASINFGDAAHFRLSHDVVPMHYSIKIRPDMDNKIFFGEVRINLRSNNNLDKILLHSKSLVITDCYLNHRKALCKQENEEMIAVSYENEVIEPGAHLLMIKYEGQLNENRPGFSKDPAEDGEQISFVYVTDLEPTSARKVFPCFDEPSFKAKFSLRLVAPNDTYEAISNMEQINKFKTAEGVVYDFKTSVIMSTYLVSFVFTQFSVYEDVLEDGDRKVPIRIHTINANEQNNAHAVNCTKKAIKFYTEYTNISYPLSKLDMIEYNRSDTAATENWGLITFRQGLLSVGMEIYDNNQIRLVIYHELSHFWFGNLVTNDWWNDLWLQEGFATYMSYKLDAKEYNTSQVKVMKSYQFDRLYDKEISTYTKPVASYLANHEEIGKKFDSVVYDKGAGVLLMLEEIVGEQTFQDIIRTYLKRHAYKTATTDDFISILDEKVPDINLRGFIESYIYQDKFPIISISETDGTYFLKQQVCETLPNITVSGEHLWTIPVSYITDKDAKPKIVWFDRDMDTLEIKEPEAKWIVFNPNGKGMFKINLTNKVWENLLENFHSFDDDLSEIIISDLFYAYRFNYINCDIPVNFMKNTRDPQRWTLFFPFYDYLSCQLINTDKRLENEIFWKFLIKRFKDTGFKKKPTLRTTCDEDFEEYSPNEGTNSKNLIKCAAWLKEFLIKELDQ